MRSGTTLLSLLMLGVLTVACDRRDRLAAPDSTAAQPTTPPARAAYLSVSDLSPERGDTVVVAGRVTLDETLSLGSFRVRLAFDTSRLNYAGEIATPGMLRVVNSRGADIIIAGATTDASADGRLFTLRFRVRDRAGLNSLALEIDELNDESFADQSRSVTRASRLMHDSTLAPSSGRR